MGAKCRPLNWAQVTILLSHHTARTEIVGAFLLNPLTLESDPLTLCNAR